MNKRAINTKLSGSPTPTLVQTVNINIGDGTWNTNDVSGWNKFCYDSSYPFTLLNSSGSSTGWSISRGASSGVGEGPVATTTTTGYPVGVTERLQGHTDASSSFTISGLNNSYTYEFDVFCSMTRTWESAAGTTTCSVGGTSQVFLHENYLGDVKTLAGLGSIGGSIQMYVARNGSAYSWYLNTIVIREYS